MLDENGFPLASRADFRRRSKSACCSPWIVSQNFQADPAMMHGLSLEHQRRLLGRPVGWSAVKTLDTIRVC